VTAPTPESPRRPSSFAVRIVAKRTIATDIVLFELAAPDGADLPPFTAGGHIPIRVPNGRMRTYSLCNDPATLNRYDIAVKREANGRGGSISLIDQTAVGDLLTVGRPRNLFPLTGNPARYIFIAGGIGITPFRSMMAHLQRTGDKPFKLYYFTRSADHMAFRDEFMDPGLRGRVTLHHDGGDPAQAFDLWPALEHPKGAYVYCCGPRGLMDAVRDMTGHWPQSAVHFEDFGTANLAPSKLTPPVNAAFTIRLAKSGLTLTVPPDRTILDVVRAAGVEAASSCESGTCGTCFTGLLGGEADHRDHSLTDTERARAMLICVSRGKAGTELVLDL
jgi:phthalate 4,5-dioxygenase reductase component